jgi:hypothetical protein
MNRPISLLLILVAATACQQEQPREDVRSIEVREGNYAARLDTMPPGERNAVFIRAIRDARLDCPGVTDSRKLAEIDGRPAWQARCSNGGEWVIVIGRDGIAQVASADQLRR